MGSRKYLAYPVHPRKLGTGATIVHILGVDFSGAQDDRNTWLAEGFLEGNRLSLESCRPVSRHELDRAS